MPQISLWQMQEYEAAEEVATEKIEALQARIEELEGEIAEPEGQEFLVTRDKGKLEQYCIWDLWLNLCLHRARWKPANGPPRGVLVYSPKTFHKHYPDCILEPGEGPKKMIIPKARIEK